MKCVRWTMSGAVNEVLDSAMQSRYLPGCIKQTYLCLSGESSERTKVQNSQETERAL